MKTNRLEKCEPAFIWRSDYLRKRRRWMTVLATLTVLWFFSLRYVSTTRNTSRLDRYQTAEWAEELNDLKNRQAIYETLFPAGISLKQGLEIADSILMSSEQYGIPTSVILALIKRESRFDPLAVSPKKALGMMQIRPDTWAEYTRKLNLKVSLAAAFDPITNIKVGVSILKDLHDFYKPIVPEEMLWYYVLAAYATGRKGTSRALTGFQKRYAEDVLKSSEHYETRLTVPPLLQPWSLAQNTMRKNPIP